MASSTTVTESPTEILKAMSPAERKEWRISGKTPEPASKETPKEVKTPADSSPAAKESPEPAKAETSAAPVPAKEEPKPKGAEARIKELLSANKQLESELDELRKRPIAAPAKIEEVAKPRRNDVDPKTGFALFATDDAFETALDTYLTTKIKAESRREFEENSRQTRIAEQNRITEKRWKNSLEIAMEQHSDFAKVLDIGDEGDKKGVFRNKDLKTIKTNGVLDAWILDSEYGAAMLYHLAKNPAEIERIQSLSPFHAARELTKLEDKLSAPSAPEPQAQESSSSSTEPQKRVSSAPAPAASVGGKATAPVNAVDAALKAEDFGRFKREANAPVNFSGICCTITMPGQTRDKCVNTTSKA